MKGTRGVWAKKDRKAKLMQVLHLLMEMQEATYTQLKEKIKVSDPTLSSYIKELTDRNLIEWFETADRREKKYRIKSKAQATSELQKYVSIEFIETLEKPVYARVEKGKATINVFISPTGEQDRKFLQRKVKGVANKYAWALRLVGGKLLSGRRLAVVLTIEG